MHTVLLTKKINIVRDWKSKKNIVQLLAALLSAKPVLITKKKKSTWNRLYIQVFLQIEEST